jgi:hypothetical protein
MLGEFTICGIMNILLTYLHDLWLRSTRKKHNIEYPNLSSWSFSGKIHENHILWILPTYLYFVIAGWEILHFVLFVYFQLGKDQFRCVQVGRFYILCYSCIFSWLKIMWDVYRLQYFTFCVIRLFSADVRSCDISQPVCVSHYLSTAKNTWIVQNVKSLNLYTCHMILRQLKIHE